ncbi:MAG: hypothetical protein CVU24_16595 [Betaproteobacteria bacterium HGW-Betaproteobacteria-18]|nr:MAG: hypothetical protein CVU24_16595 [Betaproteobacteria bacterium HGW-Betaproteobacteria-18]
MASIQPLYTVCPLTNLLLGFVQERIKHFSADRCQSSHTWDHHQSHVGLQQYRTTIGGLRREKAYGQLLHLSKYISSPDSSASLHGKTHR